MPAENQPTLNPLKDDQTINTNSKQDSQGHCALASGSTTYTTERKVLVAIGGLCIAVFCTALLGIAFYAHVIVGLFAVALIAWWIGASIGEVLKEYRKRDLANVPGQPRRDSDVGL